MWRDDDDDGGEKCEKVLACVWAPATPQQTILKSKSKKKLLRR